MSVEYGGHGLAFDNVLIDCGSATTVLQCDLLATIGVVPRPQDRLRSMWGIGGSEPVFRRQLDSITVGDATLTDWTVDVAAMDYGYEIDGILGTDALMRLGALLDFANLTLVTSPSR